MRESRWARIVIGCVALFVAASCSTDSGNAAGAAGDPTGPANGAAIEPSGEGAPDRREAFDPVRGFRTDFSQSVIDPAEVVSGGPAKDGIPAIDHPEFISVTEASAWLTNTEPVFAVTAENRTHIYPVQILTYHEIVNDVVGSLPLTVTYCPLCNSGLTFRREFEGYILDFGTTGRLRMSNLIMYDRQTETWWQQATGEGLVGEFAGSRLELYPMLMLPWENARERFPDAAVLSRNTGYSRPYGRNPYAGYDSAERPFLYRGPQTPGPYVSLDRVISVVQNGESVAFAYPLLAEQRLIQRDIGGEPVVVFWGEGTASALDSRDISTGRDVGVANAFSPVVKGMRLTFVAEDGRFRDRETGSVWDISGHALAGELAGESLVPIVGIQHFWFSYSAFAREGRWSPAE